MCCGTVWAPGAVSSLHAKVTATAKGVQVQDLGSTNGTFVDGKKVRLAVYPRTVIPILRFPVSASSEHAFDTTPSTPFLDDQHTSRLVAASRHDAFVWLDVRMGG